MHSRVVSETWSVQPTSLDVDGCFDLLDQRPFAFLYGEGRFVVLAQEPLALWTDTVQPQLAWSRRGEQPPILPDLIGWVGYETGYSLEPLVGTPPEGGLGLPGIHLALYREIRVIDRETGRLYVGHREGLAAEDGRPNLLREGPFSAHKVFDTETPTSYGDKVRCIRDEIAAGNVYQVNLTRQEGWRYQGDLRTFARRLHAENPAPFSAFITTPDHAVISSSPERFARITDGWLETRPIKGTAPRGVKADEDAQLAADLMGSAKNRSELAMIVDLLRNDLARACVLPSVEVCAFPELESYANVHHLVATVRGRLREGLSFHDLLEALFPGGSVTGCPKLAAMQLIRALESRPREVYTGALGWMRSDLQQTDLALPIRTAWADGETLVFGVGGGVVWDSDPDDEYLETLHKGRSLVRCLS